MFLHVDPIKPLPQVFAMAPKTLHKKHVPWESEKKFQNVRERYISIVQKEQDQRHYYSSLKNSNKECFYRVKSSCT